MVLKSRIKPHPPLGKNQYTQLRHLTGHQPKAGKNFFDFVNSYRVEALKEHLLDQRYDVIKIEELAFMCGFNSKAAFQRAFKKHTGTLPCINL